jgi:hypothetical protein
VQRAAPKAAGCTVVRAEKTSAARQDGRIELQVLLDFAQPETPAYDSPCQLDERPSGHRVSMACPGTGSRH